MFPLTFFLLGIVMRNLYSLSACAPNHGGYAKGRVCAQLKGNPTEKETGRMTHGEGLDTTTTCESRVVCSWRNQL